MAFDEGLAERLRDIYFEIPNTVEKKMFGGLAFMVRGHMTTGIVDESLMVRVGKDNYEEALKKPHTRKMDFTGKPLTGFIYVAPGGIELDDQIEEWVELSLSFTSTLPAK